MAFFQVTSSVLRQKAGNLKQLNAQFKAKAAALSAAVTDAEAAGGNDETDAETTG